MHRIQIQLTDAQERALREMARLRGQSISALIREGVDRLIAPVDAARAAALERMERALGAGNSGLSDVSRNHDKYLAEAYAQVGRIGEDEDD